MDRIPSGQLDYVATGIIEGIGNTIDRSRVS